jgi:hypothetical protein
MKNIMAILTVFFTLALCSFTFAQPVSISRQLHSFSPMAQIYLKHLGLSDKNNNGVIEKGAGEGYEAFTAKYGNADIGFYANGITQSANNGKLEEPEIINHYYINIRFKPDFQNETTAIESEVKTFVYANNIPLVWLDDRYGTVMNAVNRILGEGWNEREVTEDEAVTLFNRAMQGMRIRGRTGDPGKTGYYTLPRFIRNREGYCFEISQFGFWFFSQLRINSIMAYADITPTLSHAVIIQTDIQKIIDYTNTNQLYAIQDNKWIPLNSLNSLGYYYMVEFDRNNRNINALEQAIIYNKYDITIHALMMRLTRPTGQQQYAKIIAYGEFVLENTDIQQIVRDGHIVAKNNLQLILIMLLVSYYATDNTDYNNRIALLLQKYYGDDPETKKYLNDYWIRRSGS